MRLSCLLFCEVRLYFVMSCHTTGFLPIAGMFVGGITVPMIWRTTFYAEQSHGCPIHPKWVRWTKAMSNQTHRKSVRERLSINTAKYSWGRGGGGVENVGKRTPSDPMQTGCPSDCRVSVRERLSKYTARYSWWGGGKCRQTDSIGSDGDGLLWQKSIGLPRVSLRDTDGDGLPWQELIGLYQFVRVW